ncbi:MAG: class 1 fructose-bisphosphatase [Ignavibacteria bacterium]|nr:class 1 fructose-bisphosphatase [Ignavibacteria bacterium]
MVSRFTTFYRHIVEEERKYPEATGQLSDLLADIALACKVISLEVNRAGLIDILGFTGEENIQGEQVKKLDVYANDVLTNVMKQGGHICAVCSEEEENFIPIDDKFTENKYVTNKYICHFDPLDGSSNIEVNVSIGTIFSVYKRVTSSGPGALEDCLQKGIHQVAAGYVIYGSSTVLVYTTGKGVHVFTLDPSVGEFLLSNENVTIPKKAKTFSVNEGNFCKWSGGMKKYVSYLKEIDSETSRPYSSRYIGSLVADFHRNLLYGGIFMYPADNKNINGKLRLMYEANPLSFIVEQAGGKSSDGNKRILDIEPKSLHQRTPLFIGSSDEVTLIEKYLSEDL